MLVQETIGPVAVAAALGEPAAGCRLVARGGAVDCRGRRPRQHPHRQRARPKDHPQQPRLWRDEAQVHVVPRHRRVAPGRRRRARHDLRVGVPLDDLATCRQRRVVERVGKLAEAAADRRHHAALAQHAAVDVAAGGCRASHLPPEAEHGARRQLQPVERGGRAAQVLHLAHLQAALGEAEVRPQLADRLGRDVDERAGVRRLREPARRTSELGQAATQAKDHRLRLEQRHRPARRSPPPLGSRPADDRHRIAVQRAAPAAQVPATLHQSRRPITRRRTACRRQDFVRGLGGTIGPRRTPAANRARPSSPM